jgi:hypothetical protein
MPIKLLVLLAVLLIPFGTAVAQNYDRRRGKARWS